MPNARESRLEVLLLQIRSRIEDGHCSAMDDIIHNLQLLDELLAAPPPQSIIVQVPGTEMNGSPDIPNVCIEVHLLLE